MSRAEVFVERVPRSAFAEMFLAGGAFAGLVGQVRESHGLLDLDFWVDSRANLERASLYCGLTKLADLYAGRDRRMRLEITGLVRRRLQLADGPVQWRPAEDHAEMAAELISLIDRAVPVLPESHVRAGRILHADPARTVLARTFGPRFSDDEAAGTFFEDVTARARDALVDVGGIPPNLPPKRSCDALMVDGGGRLLLVEAEAPRSPEIGFAPARAAQHIALWDAWIAADDGALSQLQDMAGLRELLGLCPAGTANLLQPSELTRATCVLATETSASAALLGRMERATALLARARLLDATRFRSELT